jgi:DNA-binding transcriptional regulator YiaG
VRWKPRQKAWSLWTLSWPKTPKITKYLRLRFKNRNALAHCFVTPAAEARAKVGVSQSAFAVLLGVSVRTLQDWEQGRREPSGAAKTLLRIAARTPEAVRLVV